MGVSQGPSVTTLVPFEDSTLNDLTTGSEVPPSWCGNGKDTGIQASLWGPVCSGKAPESDSWLMTPESQQAFNACETAAQAPHTSHGLRLLRWSRSLHSVRGNFMTHSQSVEASFCQLLV